MLKLRKVHHIAIICSNYKRSLEFYTQVLGMTVIAEHYRTARQSYKTDLALNGQYVYFLFLPHPTVFHVRRRQVFAISLLRWIRWMMQWRNWTGSALRMKTLA